MYTQIYGPNSNKNGIFLMWVIRRIIQKEKNKYLTRVIWIGMGGCMHDECNRLSNVNIGFESFLRGLNGYVCFRHD